MHCSNCRDIIEKSSYREEVDRRRKDYTSEDLQLIKEYLNAKKSDSDLESLAQKEEELDLYCKHVQ